MTKDDVLFGYRLQVFDLAGRTSVSHACRVWIHVSAKPGRSPSAYRAAIQTDTGACRGPPRSRPVRVPNRLGFVWSERVSLELRRPLLVALTVRRAPPLSPDQSLKEKPCSRSRSSSLAGQDTPEGPAAWPTR